MTTLEKYQKKGIISLNLYIHFKFDFGFLNEIVRRIDGIKYIINGYKIPNKKLNKESFIKAICVFS